MELSVTLKDRNGKNIQIKPIGVGYIDRILSLQEEFTDKNSFFPITREELIESAREDFILGAFSDGELYDYGSLIFVR